MLDPHRPHPHPHLHQPHPHLHHPRPHALTFIEHSRPPNFLFNHPVQLLPR